MADMDDSLLAAMLQQSIQRGQRPSLTITSNSMAPLLKSGDQILIESISVRRLQPGDIVTIVTHSQLLTHRYWGTAEAKEGQQMITRGDRPLEFDQPWPITALLGKAVIRRRRGRDLSLTTGPGGWLNRYLFHLAAAELQRLAGNRNELVEKNLPIPLQNRRSARLIRYALLFWAIILTKMIEWITYFRAAICNYIVSLS